MKVRKIIAQSRYAQVESQVPVFPFIVQGQVVQWVRQQPGQARKGRTGYCEWKWSECDILCCWRVRRGEGGRRERDWEGRAGARSSIVRSVRCSACCGHQRRYRRRDWRGQLTRPASQPGVSWARLASLLTSVDASLKWQPVRRRHKCERILCDFRLE